MPASPADRSRARIREREARPGPLWPVGLAPWEPQFESPWELQHMDEPVNRFAQELADAIAAAVARDPKVEACRQRARAAGYEMRVTLEALVGFLSRSQVGSPSRPAPPPRVRPFEISDSDRRFLRSLRISADETTKKVE